MPCDITRTAGLADLYDATTMKADLRQAHRTLDLLVDKLYRSGPFNSDRERVEHLFSCYEKLIAPSTTVPGPTKTTKTQRAA